MDLLGIDTSGLNQAKASTLPLRANSIYHTNGVDKRRELIKNFWRRKSNKLCHHSHVGNIRCGSSGQRGVRVVEIIPIGDEIWGLLQADSLTGRQ